MAIECAVCCKPIGRHDEYISCRNNCSRNYHIACLDISEVKFTQMREDGSIKKWDCSFCKEEITSKISKPDIKEASKLEAYITEKINNAVEVITNSITAAFQNEIMKLKVENKNLYQEIKELKRLIERQVSIQNIDTNPQDVVGLKKVDKINRQDQKPIQNTERKKTQQISDLGQQKVIENASKDLNYLGAIKRNIITNNNKELPETNNLNTNKEEEYITVIRKQKRRSQINTTHGTGKNLELKGTIRYAHLHVYGFDPKTAEETIIKHLVTNKINNPKIEKLNSKYPDEYSSFKISVPFELLEEAKKPDIWPAGVRINRFLERIYRRSQEKT